MEWYYWVAIGVVVLIYVVIGLSLFALEYVGMSAAMNANGGNRKLPPEYVRTLKWKYLFWPFRK